MSQIIYSSDGQTARAKRPLFQSMLRGFCGRCPNCGEGKLFARFVKAVHECAVCSEKMHHHRADDLPAYLNIVIVGHVVVGAFMMVEAAVDLPGWAHVTIWGTVLVTMSLALMQPIKGAVIGLQWANRMHGFGGEDNDAFETHG
ncbi:DUF983 domain-containing protein [Oricola cellulosilytica]|uniref:DUF983 domain-containing protein n=1 Tax=Oricola cellulosilytica TaxID=1429082 RepID=A0A4R0PBQ3_9HYPH|nr:DUF983 domain-containing protein [Oricola cellulosilytica]TCD14476.1 DUF983 domain-containing protein [Oricola cellulosilytica]